MNREERRLKRGWGACLASLMMLAAVTVAGLGCPRGIAALDSREQRDPLMKRAEAKVKVGEIDYAIALYRKLLDIDPKIARAHLDLALILHDKKQQHVRAIYHYERYLELRPKTQKKEMIRHRIRLARQSFAATALPRGRGAEDLQDVAELRRENAALKERIRKHEAKVKPVRRPPPVQPRPPRLPLTHKVKPRENLSQIAAHYGVSMDQIVKANGLPNANALKVGQVLRIPDEQD